MTQEQESKIRSLGLALKESLPDFTGSITFHLSATKNDVKYEIKIADVVKK